MADNISIVNVSIIFLALWLLIETYALSVTKTMIPVKQLPEAYDGLRIVHLSDLHGRSLRPDGRVLRVIKKAAPDLIALTGDYVHKQMDELVKYLPFLQDLSNIAPVFAVAGNHDYKAGWPFIASHLQKAGINVLENGYTLMYYKNEPLVIAGVHDAYTGRDCLERALPADSSLPVIMLVHAPTWFERLYKGKDDVSPDKLRENVEKITLTLAGHTHGGQIKLPFIGPLTTGKGNWFPKRYVEGLHREGRGWLYINRGLGQGRPLPLRFLSRPEVAVLTLRKDETPET